MGPVELVEWPVGALLLFFVPGFAIARAVFPERRFRGPAGRRGGLELFVLSFVLSVVLTVLVGYLLLELAPGGFSAGWGSPSLEVSLAAVAAVAVVVGWGRGAYARTVPATPAPPTDTGEEGAWELTRALDRVAARRRAVARSSAPDAEAERRQLDAEESALAVRREEAYER